METTDYRPEKKKKKKRRALVWVFGVLFVLAAAVLIHYRGVYPILLVECGHTVSASDFTSREAVRGSDEEKLACGWHVRNLAIGGVPTPVLIIVRDTVPPTAEPVDSVIPLGSAPGPDRFLRQIKDAGKVRVAYAQTPDFNTEWNGTIEIVLTDQGGNETRVPVSVSVRATVETLTAEAGAEIPTAERFLLDGIRGTQDTPIEPDMMHHVGSYPILFSIDGGIRSQSVLNVVDTVAPEAEPTLLVLSSDQTAEAADFVLNASDETDLSYAFVTAPDHSSRDVQDITVRITDEGGNTLDVNSRLLITDVRPRVIEARREALTPDDFENRDGQTIRVESFVPDTPGSFAITVGINGIEETLAVTVVDTTPPTLTENPQAAQKLYYTRHRYEPSDFFSADDLTPVTLSFDGEPDFDTAGNQTITVLARDTSGNETRAKFTITLREDRTPPHIYGVINRICYVNEPIAYFAEVFGEDDEDGPIEVTVDSDVRQNEEGVYSVVYRAEDQSGNVSEASCTFTLIARTVTEEELHTLTQSIMEEITTPDMVNAEKLRAIYDYVRKHLVYTNGVNHNYTDWRKAAFDAYTRGTGDCYNIYSLTRALLDETDIQYLSVERLKAGVWRTRHYWVMVNLGTGWYIFDPTWTPRHRADCFMWTKAQCNRFPLYWNYKASEYPPLATELFDYDAVVQMEREEAQP